MANFIDIKLTNHYHSTNIYIWKYNLLVLKIINDERLK